MKAWRLGDVCVEIGDICGDWLWRNGFVHDGILKGCNLVSDLVLDTFEFYELFVLHRIDTIENSFVVMDFIRRAFVKEVQSSKATLVDWDI